MTCTIWVESQFGAVQEFVREAGEPTLDFIAFMGQQATVREVTWECPDG